MSAKVKMHNGTPTLFIDDKPVFAGYLWSAPPTPEGFPAAADARRFAEAGLHLYAFDVGMQGTPPEWCGPGPGRAEHWDFSSVQARFGRVLDADPEARFHLRVHLEATPRWWRELYPEECELTSRGERLCQSFASLVWREQAKQFLRAYIAHLRSIGLGERVIAYQVCAGTTGEWVKESAMRAYTGDYSEPMRRHFRAWLRLRYQENVAALRAAGVPMAVATDLNPGTSPLRSLRLAMNMACTLFGLTPLEALRGATVHAAHALGLDDRGRLAPGLRADLALWDVQHPDELAYWIGGALCNAVIAGGVRRR